MNGSFLFLGLILLLGLALQVTHRRSARRWRPGLDQRQDRDQARLTEELRAASQFTPDPARVPEIAHLAVPRSAATDDRLRHRAAA